ncbi:hypothetical protein [Novosphingobium sp.]|uniref:hypothetical protein n=1 Tax=Novosphingobium sp. TaxID=1874826 RepID=UPI0025D8ADFF|nr:hypothetical protein [Novosphingobium sp.]
MRKTLSIVAICALPLALAGCKKAGDATAEASPAATEAATMAADASPADASASGAADAPSAEASGTKGDVPSSGGGPQP